MNKQNYVIQHTVVLDNIVLFMIFRNNFFLATVTAILPNEA
jgi:hypothetical protein